MRLPLFGFCEGDLEIFPDIVSASAGIEPVDAKASIWKVYDRDGQRLELSISNRPLMRWLPLPFLAVEYVELVERGQVDRECMRESLKSFMQAIPSGKLSESQDWIKSASFEQLAELAIRIFAER